MFDDLMAPRECRGAGVRAADERAQSRIRGEHGVFPDTHVEVAVEMVEEVAGLAGGRPHGVGVFRGRLVGGAQDHPAAPRNREGQPAVVGLRDDERGLPDQGRRVEDQVRPLAPLDTEGDRSGKRCDAFRPHPGRVHHVARGDLDRAAVQAVGDRGPGRTWGLHPDHLGVVERHRPAAPRGGEDGVGEADVVRLGVMKEEGGSHALGAQRGYARDRVVGAQGAVGDIGPAQGVVSPQSCPQREGGERPERRGDTDPKWPFGVRIQGNDEPQGPDEPGGEAPEALPLEQRLAD